MPKYLNYSKFFLILSFLLAFNGNANAVTGKVVKNVYITVAFEVDAEGHLLSVNAHSEANKVLHPQLFEEFRSYRFKSRKKSGIAVPSILQATVPMQAVQSKDGQLHLIFGEPKFQPIKLSGTDIDYLALKKWISKRGSVFEVTIDIRPDGTVSQADINTKGLRIAPEAIAYIDGIVSKWLYAVDIEAGVPQAMSTEIKIQYGERFSPYTAPLPRPGLN